jgi:hypothetical protein
VANGRVGQVNSYPKSVQQNFAQRNHQQWVSRVQIQAEKDAAAAKRGNPSEEEKRVQSGDVDPRYLIQPFSGLSMYFDFIVAILIFSWTCLCT